MTRPVSRPAFPVPGGTTWRWSARGSWGSRWPVRCCAAGPDRGSSSSKGGLRRPPPDRPQLGVIHSGVYYKPGSLKARLCVQGARLMYEFCDEHGIGYERCGKLIVALREDELPRLADLETRGHANGVPGLRRVGAAEIQSIEPGCRGVAALHSPATGIVDFGAVARALEKELRGQGVDFALSAAVTGVRRTAARPLATHAAATGRAGPSCAPGCGRTGWRCRPAARRPADHPLPRRLPADRRRSRSRSCAAWCTRCRTRSCRSSACTSPGTSTGTRCSGPPRCWPRRGTPTGCARSGPATCSAR